MIASLAFFRCPDITGSVTGRGVMVEGSGVEGRAGREGGRGRAGEGESGTTRTALR